MQFVSTHEMMGFNKKKNVEEDFIDILNKSDNKDYNQEQGNKQMISEKMRKLEEENSILSNIIRKNILGNMFQNKKRYLWKSPIEKPHALNKRNDKLMFEILQKNMNIYNFSFGLQRDLYDVFHNQTFQRLVSRRKRNTNDLILKQPSIFKSIKKEISKNVNVKHSGNVDRTVNPPLISSTNPTEFYKVPENTPTSFYEPPKDAPSEFYEVPISKPSKFYEVPSKKPSIFYEVPPPDSSLDPATVVEMLQQQGSNIQTSQAGIAGSILDQQNSVILSRPSAIDSSDSGAVSSQSLPAINTSFSSSTSSESTTVNRVSALDRNTALLAAFGLSLIPTLAVSIPFLVPSLRRGRRAAQFNEPDKHGVLHKIEHNKMVYH